VTAGLLALDPQHPLIRFPIVFVVLTALIAYWFGQGPAILSVVVGWLAFTYFTAPIVGALWPVATTSEEWAGQAVFLLGLVILATLTISSRKANRRIQQLADTAMTLNASLNEEIEERKRADEKVRRRNALLDGINRIFHQALADVTEEELGRLCLSIAEGITQSEFGFIGEINPEGRLDNIAISDPGWSTCRMPAESGHQAASDLELHGIYGRVLLDGKGFFTNDPASHPDSIGVPDGHPPLTAFLGVPLIHQGKTIGMIGLGNREGGYSAEHLEAAEALAPAILHAFLHKRMEDALRESQEARFRAIYEQAPLGIGLIDSHTGGFIQVNAKYCEIAGRTAEEMCNTDFQTITHPDDLQENLYNMRRLLEGKSRFFRMDKRYIQPDGSIVWVGLTIVPMWKDGETPQYHIAMVEDITERKRAEEELRESEERMRALTEAAFDGVAVTEGGRILEVNRHTAAMLGYRPEEMVGREVADFIVPEDRERVVARIMQSLEGVIENSMVRKDGTHLIVEAHAKMAAYGDRRVRVAALRDITERKLTEEHERELESHKRDFYKRTILAATEGKLAVVEESEIDSLACDLVRSWNVTDERSFTTMRNELTALSLEASMEESRVHEFLGCAVEAATNAIKHAQGGTARLCRLEDSLMFVMSDNGPGIGALALPDVALTKGYSTVGTLGMGYKIMIDFADKVYLATGPEGTKVAIEMKLRADSTPRISGIRMIADRSSGW